MREQVPTICFLMETRLDKEGFDKLYGNLLFQNKFIVKHPDSGGGLALLWKNNILMEVINFIANHVLAKVTEEDGFVWYLTGFYGWLNAQQKENSWKLLKYLQTFEEGPWVVVGDFNAYLHAWEEKSIRQPQNSQIEAFGEALDSCHLQDLGSSRYPYTWSNKRPGEANNRIRLDRGVVNKEWTEKFQMSKIVHLPTHASDHLPIMLHAQTYSQSRQKRDRCFKFEESWLLRSECETVVQEAWERVGEDRLGLAAIHEKFKMCGAELMAWDAPSTDPDNKAIKDLQKKLDFLNEAKPTEAAKAEYLEISKRMDELLQK